MYDCCVGCHVQCVVFVFYISVHCTLTRLFVVQAKLRLEMAQEKMRQQQAKELEDKEIEMEEFRASAQKKVSNRDDCLP